MTHNPSACGAVITEKMIDAGENAYRAWQAEHGPLWAASDAPHYVEAIFRAMLAAQAIQAGTVKTASTSRTHNVSRTDL